MLNKQPDKPVCCDMTMNCPRFARVCLPICIILLTNSLRAELPEWIWHDNKGAKPADNEVRYFRRTFDVDASVAKASLGCGFGR